MTITALHTHICRQFSAASHVLAPTAHRRHSQSTVTVSIGMVEFHILYVIKFHETAAFPILNHMTDAVCKVQLGMETQCNYNWLHVCTGRRDSEP